MRGLTRHVRSMQVSQAARTLTHRYNRSCHPLYRCTWGPQMDTGRSGTVVGRPPPLPPLSSPSSPPQPPRLLLNSGNRQLPAAVAVAVAVATYE